MSKEKSRFVCSNCGASKPKFFGRCVECMAYNTAVEELAKDTVDLGFKVKNRRAFTSVNSKIEKLSDVGESRDHRVSTDIVEFNRVLGGEGAVEGSVVLLGGDPGIGKSTLLIQAAEKISQSKKTYMDGKGENRKHRLIYLSGEESSTQIKMRAKRLGLDVTNVDIYSEIELEKILSTIDEYEPDFMIIDSIQTLYSAAMSSAPGSVSQIKECASQLTRVAKERGITMLIICHVTKDGELAGPRALEHIVDTVLHFEGDENSQYRMLRAIKNRYGAVNEIGMFLMTEKGLESVEDPTGIFSSDEKKMAGSSVYVSQEGSRAVLVEIQALLDSTNQPNPTRSSIGVSRERLNMLCAVINKFLEMPTSIYSQNVFLTLIGGMKFSDTGVDVPSLLAMLSSAQNKAIPHKSFSFGEIGLTSELRVVGNMETRVKEAARMGLKIGFIPKTKDERMQDLSKRLGIKVYECANLKDLISNVFMIDHSKDSGVYEKPNNLKKKAAPKMKNEEQPQEAKERSGFSE